MTKKKGDRDAAQDYIEKSYHEMLDESRRRFREVKLSYNDIDFASLRIDINMEQSSKSLEILTSFQEIKEQLIYFKELIESGIRINKVNQQNILRADLVVGGLLLSDATKSRFLSRTVPYTGIGYYVFIDEDAIFDLIKAEGPRILANPDVQARILEWLDDAEVAASKLKKLGNALRSYKQPVPRAKRGRAEYSFINRLGQSGTTRNIYKVLARYMRYIKDFYDPRNNKNMRASSFEKHFEELVAYALEREWNEHKHIEFEPARSMNENFVRTILSYIQSDSYINREFLTLRWEPNKLAKRMLAQALKVSVSLIEKAVPKRSEA